MCKSWTKNSQPFGENVRNLREDFFSLALLICAILIITDCIIMALIVDDEDVTAAPDSRGKPQCWHSRLRNGSAPSSIHSSSDGAMSDESSVLESISGRTRDRMLASDNITDKADRKIQSAELWKLPDDKVDDDGDPACSYVDFEDIQLNETLRSLMETKTPMLPSRLRSAVKPQHFTQPSSTFVEPQKVPKHHMGTGGIPSSTRSDVSLSRTSNYTREPDRGQLARHSRAKAKQSIDCSSQSDADVDFKISSAIDFANGSYHEFPSKSPVRSKHSQSVNSPTLESHAEAVDRNFRDMADKNSSRHGVQSLPSELSSDVRSSVPAAESELVKLSEPARDLVTSPLLTVPDTDSLDSLIARYRNLRDCSAVDTRLAKTVAGQASESVPGSYAKHSVPTSIAVENLAISVIKGTSKTVNESTVSRCMLQPTVAASRVLHHSTDIVGQADRAAAGDVEDDLCNDNFDDIRLSLQNVSMDSSHTPLHTSLQPKGQCCELKLYMHTAHRGCG